METNIWFTMVYQHLLCPNSTRMGQTSFRQYIFHPKFQTYHPCARQIQHENSNYTQYTKSVDPSSGSHGALQSRVLILVPCDEYYNASMIDIDCDENCVPSAAQSISFNPTLLSVPSINTSASSHLSISTPPSIIYDDHDDDDDDDDDYYYY